MIFLHLDLSPITELVQELEGQANKALQEGLRDLSAQTYAHIVENVQSKLHTTREKYLKHLHINQDSDGVWVISLDEEAMWIEEGKEPGSMVEDLLSSPKAKTSQDGGKYLSVPFEHSKKSSSQSGPAKSMTAAIKTELQKQGASWSKLETDSKGQPKLGLVRSFDIMKEPVKKHEGPGTGKGKTGQVMQGPTGIPLLQGVRVYQHQMGNKVSKSVVTFRTVSSKMAGTDRWHHPGIEEKKFLDEAMDWAQEQWETKMKDQIFESLNKKLK